MQAMKRTILYGLFFALLLGCGACTKDETAETGPVPKGEGTVSVTVDFRPLATAAVGSRSAGDRIKSIDDLCVLLYRTDGSLVKGYYLTEGTGEGSYAITNPDRLVTEADKKNYAEKFTPCATFDLLVPYGTYYIYAVANMGDVTTDASLKTAVGTIEGLKSIALAWQQGDVKQNDQMFGFFDDGGVASGAPNPVTIDRTRRTLHAWLRRAASKVTVAYDASRLKDNVFIYIHSVQIKDIPKSCLLGKPNVPASTEELTDGELFTYEGVAFDQWRKGLYLSNGPNTDEGGATDHAETEPASLFFYENLQTADGPLKGQDKSGKNQEVTYPDSWKGPDEEGYKDDVACGTYIEVKGYYVSDHPDRVGHGDITYRFMLGKDTQRNYAAERNHHYQLTLCFNGFANDIDWHIEYNEPDPGVYVKTPQYISYLYDRQMTAHVKVVGELVGDLEAEILENHWWPDDAVHGTSGDNLVYYWNESVRAELEKPENGFLSLRRASETVIGADAGYDSSVNHDVYYDATSPRNKRSYSSLPGLHDTGSDADDKDGSYEVVKQQDGINGSPTLAFAVPLYTRARTLTTSRGYSGNNSYTGHQRTAKVRFTAKIRYNGEVQEYSDLVDMHQVCRLVNPKGIWRSAGNADPFHVRLMILENEQDTDFADLYSEGPWRAEIAAGDWFTLEPDGQSEQGPDGTIVGRDSTAIAFLYRPVGTLSEETVRCGVIRVHYNNNTCVHLIYVRQGYAPLALKEHGVRWHTCNVQRLTPADDTSFTPLEASDPRDEGTYFKWRQPAGILASNNRTYGWAANPGSGSFALTDGTSASWGNIKAQPGGTDDSWSIAGSTTRVAKYEDYRTLLYDKDTNPHIQYGFGVLYGDGATTVATSVKDAYGYYGDETGRTVRGMRGCFVYNDLTGDNIFFPIGVEGYGRRKGKNDTHAGVLRYGNRYAIYNSPLNQIQYRPMFFDLYRQQGAIYWCRSLYTDELSPNGDKVTQSAWDINYYTFNFNEFTSNAYPGADGAAGSDACLMRLVDYDR